MKTGSKFGNQTRHWYEAQGYEAKAKLNLWTNHKAEAEALIFQKHEAEAKD